MPSVKFFNRRWHLGSDDLAIPCALGSVFHGIWAVLVALQLPKLVLPSEFQCDKSSNHLRFLAWVLCLTCVCCCYVEARIARVALRGAIFEVSARSQIEPLSRSLTYLLATQFSANLLATYMAVKEGPLCTKDIRGRLDPQEVMLGLVVSLWVASALVLLVLSLAFNLYPDFSSEEHWERRCRCIAGVLCCLSKLQSAPAASEDASVSLGDTETVLKRIARLFSYLFRHIDLVPSDIATALYLVALRQKYAQVHGSPPPSLLPPSLDPEAKDPLGTLRGIGTADQDSAPSTSAREMDRTEPVPPLLLEEALRYARFAQAAYGAALFLWIEMQRPAGLLRGLGKLLFGVGLPPDIRRQLEEPDRDPGYSSAGGEGERRARPSASSPSKPPPVRLSGLPGALPSALGGGANPVTGAQERVERRAKALLAGVPRADVLFQSTHNDITGKLPYFIALDRANKTVVLSIRGTMSLEDAVTDVLCETAPLSDLLDPRALAPRTAPQPPSQSIGAPYYSTTTGTTASSSGATSGRHNSPTSTANDASASASMGPGAAAGAEGGDPSARSLYYAHRGILGAARAIVGDLRHQGVLYKLLGKGEGGGKGARVRVPGSAAMWQPAGPPPAVAPRTLSSGRLSALATPTVIMATQEVRSRSPGTSSTALLPTEPLANPPPLNPTPPLPKSASSEALLPLLAPAPPQPYSDRALPSHEHVGSSDVPTAGGELLTPDLPDCSDFRLVITGHSLGAGAAVLVGLALRPDFPSLRVWSFAPPGALLSPALHDLCAEFTHAVVLGNDFVPRLSVDSLERLRDEMVASLACCPLNKNVLLWRSLWAGSADLPLGEVLVGEDQAPAEARAALERYRASTRAHSLAAYTGRATAPSWSDPQGAPSTSAPLVPPGPVVLLRNAKERTDDPAGSRFTMLSWFREKKWRKKASSPQQFDTSWGEARKLVDEGLLLGPDMFSSHMPDAMVDSLAAAVASGPLTAVRIE